MLQMIFSVNNDLAHKQMIIYDFQGPQVLFLFNPMKATWCFFLAVCNVFSVVIERFLNVASVNCHVFTMTIMSGVD